jgi:hypothetical protein
MVPLPLCILVPPLLARSLIDRCISLHGRDDLLGGSAGSQQGIQNLPPERHYFFGLAMFRATLRTSIAHSNEFS